MDSVNRIKILDSFRAIAILMVIAFHFTGAFTKARTLDMYPHIAKSLYPYGDQFSSYFPYGSRGVQLFYMISGFVIYLTLNRTASFKDFMIKRIVRLFPLLLVCSIITFYLPILIDPANKYLIFHRPVINFLPSLTFTELWIWNKLGHTHIEYIDNVYWTLVIEMKFYIYIALIYFSLKNNFYRNWLYFSFIFIVSYAVSNKFVQSAALFNLNKILETIFISKYILFFTLGTYFYRLYEKLPVERFHVALISGMTLISVIYIMPVEESVAFCLFSLLFLLFIYRPKYLAFLNNKPLLFIGMVSYPLYLIHENIGVLLINRFADLTGSSYSEIFIVLVLAILIFFSYLLNRYFEVPCSRFFK